MKLFILCLLLTVFHASGSIYSQNNSFNLNYSNITVSEALMVIESNSEYKFLYRSDMIDLNRKVNLLGADKRVDEVLSMIFPDGKASFRFFEDNLVAITTEHYAEQQHVVTGRVTDAETGEGLPGVSIFIQGTTIGTITDINGEYSIDVPDPTNILEFSFVGYASVERQVGDLTTINVSLSTIYTELDEIVVVGYGTAPRRTLTGATSAISGTELESVRTSNLAHNLAGKLPGLVMVNVSGEPGSDNSIIRIRGEHTLNDNNPLIVVDGVPDRAGGLDRINPQDIESISVLKDASAAIYGAQAANGVILITTKRGRKGPTQFNLDFNQGFTQPTRLPEMADAPTYMAMRNELALYRNTSLPFTEQQIQERANPTDPWLHHNTNWFDEALKPVSLQSKVDLSATGGSEDFQYRFSLGGLTEDGNFLNSSTRYNQYNFRANIDSEITSSLSLGFDVTGRYEDRNYPSVDNYTNFGYLVRGMPHEPAVWPNGKPAPAVEGGINPVVSASDQTGFDSDDKYYLQTNLRFTLDTPIEGFVIRGNASYDKNVYEQRLFQKPYNLYFFDEPSYRAQGGDPEQFLGPAQSGAVGFPVLTQTNVDGVQYMTNLIGQYTADLEDHGFSVLVGTEYSGYNSRFFEASRRSFLADAIPELFAGGSEGQTLTGGSTKGARLNFFSRINYNYQEKYLLELIGRYDGSYIFPKGKRFGFFPSVSVAWRLTQEEWFSNLTGFFNELKLRSSYGQTGNDRIEPYQYLASYGFDIGYNYGLDDEATGIWPTVTPNPDVTWEVATQFNVGIEAYILNHKFSIELDYFNYVRTDILHYRNVSVPFTAGILLPRENIGEVRNSGFDGSFAWREQVTNDFYFAVTVNGGYSKNEILFWDEAPGVPDWQKSTGGKMRAPLVYIADGVFETQADVDNNPSWPGARPGDIRFKDYNNDGVINNNDMVRHDKNNIPAWQGGLNIRGVYKNIDFSVFFQGAAGGETYVETASGTFGNYYKSYADNRWTQGNPNNHTPRAFERTEEYWRSNRNTYFYHSTDYLRLKNLEIGYALPTNLISRLGFSTLRIYTNAYNLFTWTSFEYGDPEVAIDTFLGVRGGNYPQLRIFNIGFNTTF